MLDSFLYFWRTLSFSFVFLCLINTMEIELIIHVCWHASNVALKIIPGTNKIGASSLQSRSVSEPFLQWKVNIARVPIFVVSCCSFRGIITYSNVSVLDFKNKSYYKKIFTDFTSGLRITITKLQTYNHRSSIETARWIE